MNIQTTETQRPNNRTSWDVKTERDSRRARLINLGNSNKVEMFWDMNEAATEDGVFIMKIGDKQAYLSAEELRRFLRWVK
jgi:hypothetical protein